MLPTVVIPMPKPLMILTAYTIAMFLVVTTRIYEIMFRDPPIIRHGFRPIILDRIPVTYGPGMRIIIILTKIKPTLSIYNRIP